MRINMAKNRDALNLSMSTFEEASNASSDTYVNFRLPTDSLILSIDKHSMKQLALEIGPDLVYYMAETGIGTNECIEKGCLPVLSHFYQSIPNLMDLERRNVWSKMSELRGLDWDKTRFIKTLQGLSAYMAECDWQLNEPDNTIEYFRNNQAYGFCEAVVLYCMIRKNRPTKIIEVGSGMSSRVIATAIRANAKEDKSYIPEYIIVDPYSNIDISLYPYRTTLIKKKVELIDISFFQSLAENDILFIDSSHVCKIGSDVNYEILDVLPALCSGVLIHFHDICIPYEYPKVYATNPSFRMFWTEGYLLQAFLAYNKDFLTILPMSYMLNKFASEVRPLFPEMEDSHYGGCSIWIKRVKS